MASIQVRTEADRVTLTYRHRSGSGNWKDESHPVWLDWTPCNFGGERLDWKPGILNGPGLKPRGMHWRTFKRLTAKHDAFVTKSLAGAAQRFGTLPESILDWE